MNEKVVQRMNDHQARRLVNTYSDMILRISYHYLCQTSDAEDDCQTVFLRYLSNPGKFKNDQHEKAWIIRTTINVCKDILKSADRRRTVALDDNMGICQPPEPKSDLMDAVKRLPENYRISIYLFYYEGYTAREIGALLGKRENTVCAYLTRGRKLLKQLLTDQDEGGLGNEASL